MPAPLYLLYLNPYVSAIENRNPETGCCLKFCILYEFLARQHPLLENRDEELADAVEAYYQELSGKEAYAEAYDGIAIYTKDGKAKGSRILYVRYNMKIRGIYTEVPGLETLYAVKDKDGKFDIQAEISDEQIQTIIEEVSAQTDVQELFAQVEADYEQALGSDAMLAQAVEDLKNAVDQ